MGTKLLALAALVLGAAAATQADLIQTFADFNYISETGASGLQSSYYTDTKAGDPVTGPTTGSQLPIFGPERVTYPYGVGQVPSPGGTVGLNFNQGVLGVRVSNDNLIFQLATALNPQTGYYYNAWNTWYGQGDLFVDLADSAGLRHFALLNTWGRNNEGEPISLNGGYFDAARSFHLTGGAGHTSLQGHLIGLNADDDVALAGGTGAYYAGIAPAGLDLRTFAAGGADLGSAGLVQSSVVDGGRTWHVQTWTVGLDALSADPSFDVGLHAATSCGNDQIGGLFTIPEPGALLVLLTGVAVWVGRRL
jgi:hypothetical protein